MIPRPRPTALLPALLLLVACADPGPGERAAASSPDRPVALVTGSTDGLGRELALHLASEGWHVIVHGRSLERGAEVVRLIEEGGRGSARFIPADLAILDEVRHLATAVAETSDRLDLLVNNAGIGPGAPGHERVVTPDGHELRFQVNYLSGFLLTRMLLPLLLDSSPSRVLNVASRRQEPLDFDNLDLAEGYSGGRAYGQSKLAQILFTYDLAATLEGTGVEVRAVHPAPAMDTGLVRETGSQPASTVDDGLRALLATLEHEGPGGPWFFEGTPADPHPDALDPAIRERLRILSEELTAAPPVPSPAPGR